MPVAAPIAAGVGGLGSLIGGAKGASAQQQQANAASGLYGSEEKVINQALLPYLQSMLPTANSLGQYLSTQVPGAVGATQTAANELGSYNPLQIGGLGNTISSLSNFSNPNMQSAQNTIGTLSNYNALSPAQMAALTSSLGQSGLSTINSIKNSLGSSANPNALVQSLMNTNAQNAENTTLGLGSQVASQDLGALTAAGQLASGLSGQQLSGLQSAGTLGLGASGQTLSGLSNAGSLAQALAQMGISGISGLSGLAGNLSSQSLSGLGQLGANYQNAATSAGNPYASAFGGLSTIIGSLPGYSNSGSQYNYANLGAPASSYSPGGANYDPSYTGSPV